MEINMQFHNRFLRINGKSHELEYPIKAAKSIDSLIVVLFDTNEKVLDHIQFQNCRAYDWSGKEVWTAQHPTQGSEDHYLEFMDDNKLWNFACFVCELDFKTGKLIHAEFTK